MSDTIHEIRKTGNLFYLLNAFLGAYNRRTDVIDRGVKAIALALSTPQDNSAAVQAEIDKLVSQLNTSTAELKGEIDNQTKES